MNTRLGHPARESAFDAAWHAIMALRQRVADAFVAGTYRCAGGGLFYVTWGRRTLP